MRAKISLVRLVEKSVSSVASSASIVFCVFIGSISLLFASFVSLSCFLMLLKVVLSPLLGLKLSESFVGC